MRVIQNRRAVTNIIAVLLIFALMSGSMALLYSRIAPTVIGFEAESTTANQEFIFLNIQTEIDYLKNSPVNSRSQVHINSNGATYNVNPGNNLALTFTDGNFIETIDENIGSFSAEIERNFQGIVEDRYIGNVVNEDTYVNSNLTRNKVSSVVYMSINLGLVSYDMYLRAELNTIQKDDVFQFDVFFYKITVRNPNFSDFPINIDEWTVKLRKAPITSDMITSEEFLLTGSNVIVTQEFNGLSDGLVEYSFEIPNDVTTIQINRIVVPIEFSI
jgi:hypothetical protein